jgi:PIN domain nuclease of toxin-antitoxin system
MRYLVDSHAFIWYLESNSKLSLNARMILEDGNNQCFVSVASLWEMAIKIALGRLELQTDFDRIKDLITTFSFEILPIQFEHLKVTTQLPFHHHDPFDRILIAQSQVEELILITKDEKIKPYKIETLW